MNKLFRLLYLLPILFILGVVNAGSVSLSMPSSTIYGSQLTATATQSFNSTDTIAIYVNGTQVAEAQNTTSYTFFAGSSSYYSAGLYNITAIDLNQTTDNSSTQNLTINQAVPSISIGSMPALNQFYYGPIPFNLVYSIQTYNNQLNASLYINQILISNTSTNNNYTQGNSLGDYAIVLNTTGNQNYTNNSLTNYIFINTQFSGTTQTTNYLNYLTGTSIYNPDDILSLNSNIFPQIYSAGLIIYLNPAGYFEFILSNSTSYKSSSFFSSNLYENTAPDMYMTIPLNVTNFIQNTSDYTYQGAIFYTPVIDISPLEDCILGVVGCLNPSSSTNSTGLTSDGLFTFLSQSPITYNTTIVYSTLPTLTSFLYNSFIDAVNIGAKIGVSVIIPSASSLVPLSYSNPMANNFEYITPQQNAIALLSSQYNSPNPLAVYFDLNNGLLSSKPNSQSALYQFNTYYDNQYSSNQALNYFFYNGLGLILGYTIIIYILIKINGE